jgi:acetyl-CoA C-acetyltransferase
MQSIDAALHDIGDGRSEMVLAGGTEAMSRAPLLFDERFVAWLADFQKARGPVAKARQLSRLRPGWLKPVIALLRGLTDPVSGLSMGQTAENLAWRFGISRREMDEYAWHSHQRLGHAQDEAMLPEIEPLYGTDGRAYQVDDGVRRESTVDDLGRLKPVFEKPFGKVTAGNSAQVTDGACAVLLASEEAVSRWNLPVLARIVDSEWAGVDPAQMGLGPVHAVTPMLRRHRMALGSVDYWELNEAFAAQVLACVAAWRDRRYCREQLGLSKPWGEIDRDCLNVDGGGISLGHPVGTSGARITLHLAHVLRRTGTRRGVATQCIGGGQGGAMLIENPEASA